MHSYYSENKEKLKKSLNQFMQLVKPELEKAGGKPCPAQLLLYSCFPCIIDCDSIQSCGGLFRRSLQDAEAEP